MAGRKICDLSLKAPSWRWPSAQEYKMISQTCFFFSGNGLLITEVKQGNNPSNCFQITFRDRKQKQTFPLWWQQTLKDTSGMFYSANTFFFLLSTFFLHDNDFHIAAEHTVTASLLNTPKVISGGKFMALLGLEENIPEFSLRLLSLNSM